MSGKKKSAYELAQEAKKKAEQEAKDLKAKAGVEIAGLDKNAFAARRASVQTSLAGAGTQTSTQKDLGIQLDATAKAQTKQALENLLSKKRESSSPKSVNEKKVGAVNEKMGKNIFKGITAEDPVWHNWYQRLTDERQKGMVEQFFIKFKAGSLTMEQVEKTAKMQGIPPMNEASVPLTPMETIQQQRAKPPTTTNNRPPVPPRPKTKKDLDI